MKVEVEARVLYTCELNAEDEEIVRDYVEENGGDFSTAIWECYCNHKINLYHDSTESDFSTEEIISVEE